MAFREVGGRKKYYELKKCSKGQVLVEGTYLSDVVGRFGKQFDFESESGEIVCFGGKHLEHKMQFVKPGTKCKVVYDGMIILEKGDRQGNPAHQFIVLVDSAFDEGEEEEVTDDEVDEFVGM